MAEDGKRKFKMMQYKKDTKAYEFKFILVGDGSVLPPACRQVPDNKITYRFESASTVPPASSLQQFELFAEDKEAERHLPKLGQYFTENRRVGRMTLKSGDVVFLLGVAQTAHRTFLQCAVAKAQSVAPAAAPPAPAAPAPVPAPPPPSAPPPPPPPPPPKPSASTVEAAAASAASPVPASSSAAAASAAAASAPAASAAAPATTPAVARSAAAPAPAALVPVFVVRRKDESIVVKRQLGGASEWVIGRDDTSAIRVKEPTTDPNQKATISRRHARLFVEGGKVTRTRTLTLTLTRTLTPLC